MMQITTQACMLCGNSSVVEVTNEEYFAVIKRVPMQDALPERDNDFRELLISGTHPTCWNILFPEDEEDEDGDEDELDGPFTADFFRKEHLNGFVEDANDEDDVYFENVPEDA